jgi:hypothetical protein
MDASELVDRVRLAYKACESYADEGTAKFTAAGLTRQVSFQTLFLKPNKYRFVCWKKPGTGRDFAAWHNEMKHLSSFEGELYAEEDEDVSIAIAGAHGASVGAASNILPFLLHESWKDHNTLLDLEDFAAIGRELVDGSECHVLKGLLKRTGFEIEYSLFVSVENFAIRRVRRIDTGTHPAEGECAYSDVILGSEISSTEFEDQHVLWLLNNGHRER